MARPQQGLFSPKFPGKYVGKVSQIVYRSSWEHMVFMWCDENADVVEWSSEEIVIPYMCRTDNKMHRYFPDVKIKFKSGTTMLVEIKPYSQVQKPVRTKGKKGRTYLMECFTYMKNTSKWDAAEEFCRQRGYIFQIWSEPILRSLGIPVSLPRVKN